MEIWQRDAQKAIKEMPEEIKALRENCKYSLKVFAETFFPQYVYGEIHYDIMRELEDYNLFGSDDDITSNKIILLPRAHLKSHLIALIASWFITRHPEVTILYVSATAELAETQLFVVQNILGSSRYRKLFPEYINPEEGKRTKWTTKKIIIDHPIRTEEGIRDATVATAGLTTNTTGWHADIILADDLVVPENAYTEEGRESVRKKSSQFTSIRNAGGFTLAAGTRYHPSDVYDTWREQTYNVYDEISGDLLENRDVWKFIENKVEIDNEFLWPRTHKDGGKSFGFNRNILARIKGEYEDITQFYAQYYNDPNEKGSNRIDRSRFQYYDKKNLEQAEGRWWVNGKPLNLYASIDFAFSKKKRSDYTAIVVIGMDPDGYIYIIDIDRFQTDKTSIYFEHILDLHSQYNFKKLRAEVSVAQVVIVNDLKDMIRKEGMSLSVDEHRPNRHQGSKEERISSILEPRYDNLTIWHYKGGYIPALEEEVILARPKHDDIKDALTSAIAIARPPRKIREMSSNNNVINFDKRFGGTSFRRG